MGTDSLWVPSSGAEVFFGIFFALASFSSPGGSHLVVTHDKAMSGVCSALHELVSWKAAFLSPKTGFTDVKSLRGTICILP